MVRTTPFRCRTATDTHRQYLFEFPENVSTSVVTVVETSPRPADPDTCIAARLADTRMHRLVALALGLSAESMDLLTSVTDRLRAAEGALPDPLTADLD